MAAFFSRVFKMGPVLFDHPSNMDLSSKDVDGKLELLHPRTEETGVPGGAGVVAQPPCPPASDVVLDLRGARVAPTMAMPRWVHAAPGRRASWSHAHAACSATGRSRSGSLKHLLAAASARSSGPICSLAALDPSKAVPAPGSARLYTLGHGELTCRPSRHRGNLGLDAPLELILRLVGDDRSRPRSAAMRRASAIWATDHSLTPTYSTLPRRTRSSRARRVSSSSACRRTVALD